MIPLSRSVPDYTVLENTYFLADGRTVSLLYSIPEPVYLLSENYWADGRTTLNITANIPFIPEVEQPRRHVFGMADAVKGVLPLSPLTGPPGKPQYAACGPGCLI